MSKKLTIPLSLLTTLFLTGCAPTVSKNTSETSEFADRMIADKVAIAANAQRDYTALLNNDKAVLGRKQASLGSDYVDIDYIGVPQELLQTFSYRYGYRYIEVGKRRSLKNINIKVKNMSPQEVLRNIGYQIDKGADVTLDQKQKTIRLSYK
ncbi:DotD/TraH family lipoprotein [Yersinia enterocolitica]|nr:MULTISPECIES: DotD/TraH family lipoprotein [Yersinia]EKN3395569.1 DotD/TraH family lipoprotein [Yersinia enterocolitica]EKN3501132.1 DotD/TraH family lipoprotein [Yersinia enterocolitica]EKN3636584.1 DotD/TraH family lipoprotein [Yersinia enterocolitica]EKN3687146.1 DotD/TraH family lipoprotein [Yersinia enterocolitica]EKN3832480.1 DotD/TraH family lipoprotein [Yersinia enterocolitica]